MGIIDLLLVSIDSDDVCHDACVEPVQQPGEPLRLCHRRVWRTGDRDAAGAELMGHPMCCGDDERRRALSHLQPTSQLRWRAHCRFRQARRRSDDGDDAHVAPPSEMSGCIDDGVGTEFFAHTPADWRRATQAERDEVTKRRRTTPTRFVVTSDGSGGIMHMRYPNDDE